MKFRRDARPFLFDRLVFQVILKCARLLRPIKASASEQGAEAGQLGFALVPTRYGG
jgi:hypothetical protein